MTFRKCLISLTMVAVLNSTTGCGLLLHPERQGTRGGNLDPAIVLLDGIGLFFFLVPGIIAFAVDFVQGTIYMGGSGGRRHLTGDLPPDADALAGMKMIKINGPLTKANIEAAIARELGRPVDITSDLVQVQAIDPRARQTMQFAGVSLPH